MSSPPASVTARVCESDPCLPAAHKDKELFQGTHCLLLLQLQTRVPEGSATKAFA